jgi:hypothetical protein
MVLSKKQLDKPAVIWLDQENLFLGLPSEQLGLAVHRVHWNAERLDIQSPEANQKLSAALSGLVKQFSIHRMSIRLCLDDGLCVTRVVTGEPEDVDRELEAIRQRSQLYLSLGLGEKLTGSLSKVTENRSEYALTSIVNLRTIQTIYSAFTTARLRLASIEPVTLSVTRALGLIGVDKDRPVLFVSVDNNRCDLAITRSGQLMLSYRISGVHQPQDIAIQIASNLTRLRRFCERVRGQGDSALQSIYIFGEPTRVEALKNSLVSVQARIEIASVVVPDAIRVQTSDDTNQVVVLALWAAAQWREDRTDCLPAPDILAQLQLLQSKSLPERLIAHFFPSAIAAGLMLAVFGLYLNDHRKLAAKKQEIAAISVDVSNVEVELAGWESKQQLIDAYKLLENQIVEGPWNQLIKQLAPCIPNNARLDSFQFNDDRLVTLRGTMVGTDQTYEMLAAIKHLSNVSDVSLESVNAMGDLSQKQLQFELKFRVNSNATATVPVQKAIPGQEATMAFTPTVPQAADSQPSRKNQDSAL